MCRLAPLAVAGCLLAAGCAAQNSGVSPTGSAVLDALAGTWTSDSLSAGPAGCNSFDYTVTKNGDGTSAAVTFDGVCAGVSASGTGTGTVSGSKLNWTAEGTATRQRDGLACSFNLGEGTATREGSGVRVTFAGTLCGLPVSGSELLQRK